MSPFVMNAEEIAYWNERAGDKWAAWQDRIDAAFAPITAAALARAEPHDGEAALDVGCGCGETVLRLAHSVGDSGHVIGVDVSRPMLAVAENRARAAELANVTLLLADAAEHRFESATFDLLFSRFGVMFFDQPIDAFANMRRGLRADGRVAFVCWRRVDENPWFAVPRDAVQPLVPQQPAGDPDAPGPTAFADSDRVHRILTGAGFRDVRIDPFDTQVSLGTRAGAVDFLLQIGPASRLLQNADPATRATAAERLGDAVREHETAAGVMLGAAVWLVRASA